MAAHQPARFGKVLGPLHERQPNPVAPLVDREGKVAAVLLGECGDRHFGVGDVDALAIGDDPADFGGAQHALGLGLDHPQADLAVVDQQALALVEHREQLGMRQLDSRLVARRGVAV